MQFDEIFLGLRSIRGYKTDPVPKALIKEVLALAMRSPSSMNTQPWNFTVVSGEPLNRIRAGNTERNLAGVPHSREFRIGQAFAGQHRDRQVGVAKQLFSAMGIEREDKETDVFVHASAVREAGLKFINEGDELTFEVAEGEKYTSAVKLQKTY